MTRINLDKYYDLALELTFVAKHKRNTNKLKSIITMLETERNNYVSENGITEDAIHFQEVISQLKITCLEALNEDYSKDLEQLEYITSINIINAQNMAA
jgi:hypothetical protein